ncbi:hypothetical protein CPB83DRAFT_882479 [Crepidotus variabilis]|uniref:DUF6534 domain-containing protein n=1 Tax=Crepidotus variabilis TaxID=179855 RepID=A0A9P6EJM5_9AGAR|nr:hypothetical protein CPB83DRAFT_882479 [Crepidotus variabilis]
MANALSPRTTTSGICLLHVGDWDTFPMVSTEAECSASLGLVPFFCALNELQAFNSSFVGWMSNFVAPFACAGIWGLTLIQTLVYFFNYHRDPLPLKFYVGALWLVETLHQGSITYIATTPNRTDLILFTRGSDIILNVLPYLCLAYITFMAQLFFAYKLGKLLHMPSATILCLLPFILFQLTIPVHMFVTGRQLHLLGWPKTMVYSDKFQTTVNTFDRTYFSKALIIQRNHLVAALVTAIFVNCTLAGLLGSHLWQWYFRTPSLVFKSTTPLFYRITFFSFNIGIWSAIGAVLSLILVMYFPNNNVSAMKHIQALSSLYASSVLANLNARATQNPTGAHVFLPVPKDETIVLEPLRFRVQSSQTISTIWKDA